MWGREKMGEIRRFETGATRDTDEGKPDYEGYLSPLVIEAFGRYMTKHRKQPDGSLRASDNWQKGMTLEVYIKSGWRHFMDWWSEHRGWGSREGMEDALCGLLFNVMGYLHEYLKQRRPKTQDVECRPAQKQCVEMPKGDEWPLKVYDPQRF